MSDRGRADVPYLIATTLTVILCAFIMSAAL
jgi:hypothetical protein